MAIPVAARYDMGFLHLLYFMKLNYIQHILIKFGTPVIINECINSGITGPC